MRLVPSRTRNGSSRPRCPRISTPPGHQRIRGRGGVQGAIAAQCRADGRTRALSPRAVRSSPDLRAQRPPTKGTGTVDANNDGLADDVMIEIPAVGALGGPSLPGFLQGIFGG